MKSELHSIFAVPGIKIFSVCCQIRNLFEPLLGPSYFVFCVSFKITFFFFFLKKFMVIVDNEIGAEELQDCAVMDAMATRTGLKNAFMQSI